jgi:hypothetical protein
LLDNPGYRSAHAAWAKAKKEWDILSDQHERGLREDSLGDGPEYIATGADNCATYVCRAHPTAKIASTQLNSIGLLLLCRGAVAGSHNDI